MERSSPRPPGQQPDHLLRFATGDLGICNLCLLAIGFIHLRLRLERLRVRAQEHERKRIARELHDTILQGTQGLVILLHSKVLQLPASDPLNADLSRALDRAQELLSLGRDRVLSLRLSARRGAQLFDSLKREAELLARQGDIAFEANLQGEDRWIAASEHDELRWIISEALSNAFRHAKAKTVSFDMRLSSRSVEIDVVDDGIGFEFIRLDSPAAAHWGILGMRERSEWIGASMDIAPRAPGTHVKVVLTTRRSQRLQGWLSKASTRLSSLTRDRNLVQ